MHFYYELLVFSGDLTFYLRSTWNFSFVLFNTSTVNLVDQKLTLLPPKWNSTIWSKTNNGHCYLGFLFNVIGAKTVKNNKIEQLMQGLCTSDVIHESYCEL